MAKSHIYFYTDPETIVLQLNNSDTGKAFGPVSDVNYQDSQFQITNTHITSGGGSSKAIAVFDGTIIAIDPNPSDNAPTALLTLVLRPSKTVKEITKLDLPNIKYVIYKGIKKSSIVNLSNPEIVANESENDLTKAIWETQAAYNTSFGTTFDPSIKSLRLNPTIPPLPDGDIESLFASGTGSLFEPQRIKAGDYIGNFDTNFGVEFVVNEIRSFVSYSEAKDMDFIYDVSQLTGLARIKNAKERVLRYLDPAAFYGSLFPYNLGGERILHIKRNNLTTINDYSGHDVYEAFLHKLYNKNVIYFDIRNEYNQSYNFEGAYIDTVRLRKGRKNSFETINYYQDWPILRITDPASINPVTTDEDKRIKLSIKIPRTTDPKDNKNPLFLSYLNYFEIERGDPQKIKPYEHFIEKSRDLFDLDYFKEIDYHIPDKTSNGTSDKRPVSTYIKIKIFRRFSELPSTEISRSEYLLDNIFQPFAIQRTNPSGMETRTYEEDIYLGTEININGNNNDSTNINTDFISSVGYSFDDNYVTFFSFANRRRSAPVTSAPSSVDYLSFSQIEFTNASGGFLNSVSDRFRNITSAHNAVIGKIELNLVDFPGQELYRYIDPIKSSEKLANLSTEFSAISITQSSYDNILNALTSGTAGIDLKYDVHLALRNREILNAPLLDNPTENIGYSKYDLFLRGVAEDQGGDSLLSVEYDTGLKLLSYSERNTGDSKSLVLVEYGVILVDTNLDAYLPCYRNVLAADEIVDLENFIKRLYDGIAVRSNKELYQNVFYKGASTTGTGVTSPGFKFKIETNGEVFIVDNNDNILDFLPDYNAIGFFAEAATQFAIWNLCSLISVPNEDNYFYRRLIRVLVQNGLNESILNSDPVVKQALKARLFNPFNHYGERYSYPNPIGDTEKYNLVQNPMYSDYIIVGAYDNYNTNLEGNPINISQLTLSPTPYERVSLRSELFNIIRSGNLDPLTINSSGYLIERSPNGTEPVFFDVPPILNGKTILDASVVTPINISDRNIDQHLDGDLRNYIEELVGNICIELNQEIKYLVSRNAHCFYQVFTKNILISDCIDPVFRLLATGEGSTTNGLTTPTQFDNIYLRGAITPDGFHGEKCVNLGALLFTYDLQPLTGNAKLIYEESFPEISVDTKLGIHMSIFGMNTGNAPNIVEIEISGQNVKGSGGRVLMRFLGDQFTNSEKNKRKLFPEPSLDGSTSPILPRLVYPFEQRVSLESHGTYIVLLNGTTTGVDIVESDFEFRDINDELIGTYYSKWNNLIIDLPSPYTIKVKQYSGQGSDDEFNGYPYAEHSDGIFGDEIQTVFSYFCFNPPETNQITPEKIEISAEDLYPDDKFELTSEQKYQLIDFDENSREAYKKLSEIIHEIITTAKTGEIDFVLKGLNIGRLDVNNKVVRDTRFTFGVGIPPDNNRVRPETLGWVETDPTSSNVDPDLSKMYHPNDPNGDQTRLLEVPDWLPEEDMKNLRFSEANITVAHPSPTDTRISISISSFVSPIWSRLDEKVYNDFRHYSGTSLIENLSKDQRRDLLNSFTLYNNGANASDAYIKVVISGGYALKGSYNPILSCLRSFGLLEAIRDNIAFMATQSTTNNQTIHTAVESEAIRQWIQDQIESVSETVSIPSNVFIGYTMDITYDLYKKLKWYYNQEDKDLYGPTQLPTP